MLPALFKTGAARYADLENEECFPNQHRLRRAMKSFQSPDLIGWDEFTVSHHHLTRP
jgi:hypothetical protein